MPRRFPASMMAPATVLLRRATWTPFPLALVLAGCAPERPPEPTAEAPILKVEEDLPPVMPGDDRIRSIGAADGTTILVLPPRADLQVGDLLHVVDDRRLVATALVTVADRRQVLARVVSVSDRRRPVSIEDRFRHAALPVPGEAAASIHTGSSSTAAAKPAAPVVADGLVPEVRARLDAERAYWELAQRILRLPPSGPELTAVQDRLRNELAERHAKVP